MQKLCKVCNNIEEFGMRTVKGKKYYKYQCKKCDNAARYNRRISKPITEARRRSNAKSVQRISDMRRDNVDPARWILADSRGSAHRKGLPHELSKSDIAEIISDGCLYCGCSDRKMTLDRIDNSRGYTKDNVNCACLRCNYIRRDMPYTAWIIIMSAVKEAQEKNLFGDWDGFGRK